MVARINYGAHIEGVLFYNKLKLDKEQGKVLLCHNLPLTPELGRIDIRKLCEAFRPWVQNPKSRARDKVFHVSLNPHPKDQLDQMQLIEIAHTYMERMGYGEQPYIIYQHEDISRTHLHIVASRIQPNGRPVEDQNYKRRSKAITEEIEREYHLIPAQGQQDRPFEELRKVNYTESNLKGQISSVLYNLMDRYRFSSRGEFNTLLRIFNVSLEECKGEVEGRPYAGIIYGALNDQGERIGKPIPSSRIRRSVGYQALQKEYEKTKRWIRDNAQTLAPTRDAIRAAMQDNHTQETFAAAIRTSGISVVFHRSAEHDNRIYGVTFIDHKNGLVINGSRLDKAFAANRFEELFSETASKQESSTRQPQAEETVSIAAELWDFAREFDLLPDNLSIPGWDLVDQLLDEASREPWEEWQYIPRKKKKRRRILK